MNSNKVLFTQTKNKEIKIWLIPALTPFTRTSAYTSIWNIVLSAAAKIADIAGAPDGKFGAYGTFDKDGKLGIDVEIVEGGIRQGCTLLNNRMYACCFSATTDASGKTVYQREAYSIKPGHNTGVLLVATYLFQFYNDMNTKTGQLLSEVISGMNCVLGNKVLTPDETQKFFKNCAELSTTVHAAICLDDDAPALVNDNGNIYALTSIMLDSNRFAPELTMCGKFKNFANSDSVTPSEKASANNVDYTLSPERNFTEEEKLLIPKIEPWYVMPKQVPEICNFIKKSTNTYKPKRNFMLRGPSSTGKTSMARAIAAKLGLPYTFVTCSADTESYAFIGQPMYDKDGNIKYVESDFIKAIKYGWVCEIQEPYVISKQGVLTSLNGLLDDSDGIILPTGEFVRRHPDAVIIFTTNVSYVGCKKPNQSVIRRMNNVYDINMPENNEIIQRVVAVTGYKNTGILTKMVKIVNRVNEYLQNEALDDGVCGISELIDWVMTYQISHDITAAASSTIVSKATDDPEGQAGIMAKVEAYFEGFDSTGDSELKMRY